MISNHGLATGVGAFSSPANFTCLPIGLWPGKYFDAKVWFTTATFRMPATSSSESSLPPISRVPIVWKNCALHRTISPFQVSE